MPRNRVIYQSEGVYVSAPISGNEYPYISRAGFTGASSNQLYRVQSVNYSYNLNRNDINQFGQLAAIDRIMLNPPTINLDLSYYVVGGKNEESIGFVVNTGKDYQSSMVSSISGFLNSSQEERDIFVFVSPEGQDINGVNLLLTPHQQKTIGFGNMVVTNYSIAASVNEFPRATVSFEGLNMNFYDTNESAFDTYSPNYPASTDMVALSASILSNGNALPSGRNWVPVKNMTTSYTGVPNGFPSTFYTVSVLRPGDITVSFLENGVSASTTMTGVSISDMKIQNFNLSVNFPRDPINKIGLKYPVARPIRFPLTANLSIDAFVGDIVTGNLYDVITTDKKYDIQVALKHPLVSNTTSCLYVLRGAKFDSKTINSSIGSNKTVTFNFSTQLNGITTDTKADGLYIGVYPELP